jgi:glycosyltransferase involved in cell wall biosynthesis
VQFVPAIPRRNLFAIARKHDLGLALMPVESPNPNLRYLLGASNKPFDYLACGLGLLISDLPDWRRAYVEPGYGLTCNPEDPSSVAAAVVWFLEHRAETVAMGERGRQRITTEWNYETQFSPALAYITKMSSAS